MKLKDYQERALAQVKRFLEQLVVWRGKARGGDEWHFDFAERARRNIRQEEGWASASVAGVLSEDSDRGW